MHIIIKILNRIIIIEYYKENLFFFMLIIGLLTGFGAFPNPVQLQSEIMLDISKNAYLLIVTLLVFTLYNLKCYYFIIKKFATPENKFLGCFIHLTKSKFFSYMFYTHIAILLPFLIYIVIAVIIAFLNTHYLSGVYMLGYSMLLAGASSLFYYYKIWKYSNNEYVETYAKWSKKLKKSRFFYYVLYLLQEQEICLVVTKLCSSIVLLGVINAYDSREDVKLIEFGVLTCIFIHTTLIFKVKLFEDQTLLFLRALPISINGRALSALVSYTIILIPEFLILSFNLLQLPLFFTNLFLLIPLSLSIILFFHAILYTSALDINNYITYSFCIYLLFTIIILFGIHLFLLSCLFFLISYCIFYRYYYRYEKNFNFNKSNNL